MGQGGTIIDFIQHFYQTTDIAKALSIIVDVNGGVQHVPVLTQAAREIEVPKERPIIESIGSINDSMLEKYV